jgi:hypothetical protein
VAQAGSIRESLAYEVREMYRSAGLSPGSPTEVAQPESGVAKAFAFNEVEARLSAIVDACEHAENTVIARIAQDAAFTAPAPADYPDEFAPIDLATELEYTIRVLTSPLPQTMKSAQARRFGEYGFQLSPQEKAAVEAELAAPINDPPAERTFGT